MTGQGAKESPLPPRVPVEQMIAEYIAGKYKKLVLNLYIAGDDVPMKFDFTALKGRPASMDEAMGYIAREKANNDFIPVSERRTSGPNIITWVSAFHIVKVTVDYMKKEEEQSSTK